MHCFHKPKSFCLLTIRMKVSIALLMLCCLSLTDGQTNVQEENNLPNIWEEVRDIRDMMVELRVKLEMVMNDNSS